jgi:hypothetical protein
MLSRPQGHRAPEGLSQWKIPMTPTEIETATFQLVAQCPVTLPSTIPQHSTSPPTYLSRRTSRHCLGTFTTVTFSHSTVRNVVSPPLPPTFCRQQRVKACIPCSCHEPKRFIMLSLAGICFRNKGAIMLLEKENKSVSKMKQVGTACRKALCLLKSSGTTLKQPSGES